MLVHGYYEVGKMKHPPPKNGRGCKSLRSIKAKFV